MQEQDEICSCIFLLFQKNGLLLEIVLIPLLLMKQISNKQGLLALSPMLVLVGLMVGLSLWFHDFYKVPLAVIFVATAVVALFTLRGMKLNDRIAVFSRGAGDQDLMLMLWIFVLAGAFAASAKAMGSVDATVNMTLAFLPAGMLLPGIFLAACVVSISIGTSVGTIAALMPIVVGLAGQTGLDLPMLCAATVGGAFFGDNLSFISDTTVVATKTQGCRMSDKFKTNFFIALPAAVMTFILYLIISGHQPTAAVEPQPVDWLKVVPYAVVLITAILGMNVLVVLLLGILLTGIIGLSTNSYALDGWFAAMKDGISGMSETILIALLAGGLLAVIRYGGGIDWIIQRLTRRVNGRRGAELSIALLVSLVNFCTANNTVAILSVGTIARDIAHRFGVDPRRAASILDTFSCCIQGIIPYGAQLLIASGLASIPATMMMPYLYYPYLLGLAALVAILIGQRTKPKALSN